MASAGESVDLLHTITLGIIFQRNGLELQMMNAREHAGTKEML